MQPKRFAIWANTDKSAFWELLPGIVAWAKSNGMEIFLTQKIIAASNPKPEYSYQVISSADDFYKVDFVLTLGGDGTILSAARAVGGRDIPILGIHLGDLGFLAEVTVKELYRRLDQVAAGSFQIQPRMILNCEVQNGDQVRQLCALNDMVIDKGKSHRMITTRLEADGRFVAAYKADGLIVATPTGSTAYALAAGGPIVVPGLGAIVVAPICPHSLNYRPLVLNDNMQLKISFPESNSEEMAVTVDGQLIEYLTDQHRVVINKAEYKIQMIVFDDSNYFQTLRAKMGWGRRGEN